MYTMLEFDGPKLKQLRKKKGLKQSDLAALVGKRPEHISNYENGYATPPSGVLLSLLQFFKIQAADLSRTKTDAN